MDEEIPPSINKENQETRVVFPKKNSTKRILLKVSITAMLIGLNTVMTMVFVIILPASNGFFNIGESMVYISAILFGPYIGALASGVGAGLADILLGVAHYAPATLIVKGTEALIVGFVYQKLMETTFRSSNERSKKRRELLTIILIVLAISGIILSMGLVFSLGPANIEGFNNAQDNPLYRFHTNFGYPFWLILTGIVVVFIFGIYIFLDSKISMKIIAMFTGGVEMIIGYLIYATILYGFAAALTEVPFNLLQVCIGIGIAVPISGLIKNTLKL